MSEAHRRLRSVHEVRCDSCAVVSWSREYTPDESTAEVEIHHLLMLDNLGWRIYISPSGRRHFCPSCAPEGGPRLTVLDGGTSP